MAVAMIRQQNGKPLKRVADADAANAAAAKTAAEAQAKLRKERQERVERWEGTSLSEWYVRTSIEEGDVLRAAAKSANQTGYPQRILWIGDGKDKRAKTPVEGGRVRSEDVVEPKRGGDGMGDRRPDWVRRRMGDL